MSYTAIILIIISAFMHALWNFVSKRRNPSLAYFFVAATSASVIISPLLVIHRHILTLIPVSVWSLVAATGVAQMIYFMGLAGAYKRGDISLAYPLARALPVLLVAAISLILGNGADIGPLSLVGMGLITVGCIILPLPHFQKVRPSDYFDTVYLMAFVAALGTTSYTLIDDTALQQLHDAFASQFSSSEITLLFIALQTTSTAVMLGIGSLIYPAERRQLWHILHHRRLLASGLVTGAVILGAYGLVLASMTYVTNVSYVAAFRQLSIPIGAVLGLTLQQEPPYLPKLIGIGVVSVGLVLVGIG